ncbi:hypothetical protein Daus18300_009066 [Diaporthe australafricana]|uniref:DUF676 domain-containing protein n=1 Tax=Diaporthe australafricana TaxID=127596 RepID=A0ABR3WG84_9PEZI
MKNPWKGPFTTPLCRSTAAPPPHQNPMMLMNLCANAAENLNRMKKFFQGGTPAKSRDHGLEVLDDKAPEAEGIVDVVAVHGLNGHYENTWTWTAAGDKTSEGSSTNWLRDVLPNEELVKARVMAFSYNSSVQSSKSTSDVYVFADQLLEHLMAKRGEKGEQKRPIVFICHSLGGIVVKQALNRAAENSRYKAAILYRVFGIFFFGTPHRGSELAPLGSIISRALRAGALGSHTNSQLVKELDRKSTSLSHISNSFKEHGHKIRIVSFVETEKMDWLGCLVVDRDSATLGWHNEIVVPIDGNHRNICRFSGPKDPRITPVLSNIKEMFRAIHKEHLSKVNGKRNVAHARNPIAVEGTCSWILQHEKLKAWENSPQRSLLWISADAGCGKSVLTSYLINHYQKYAEADTNVCYFFFKDDNAEQSDAVVGMSAILNQLYLANQKVLDETLEYLNGFDDGLKNVPNLWKIFEESLKCAGDSSTTICLLDGLDECEGKSREQLLRSIERYFMKQPRKKDGKHKLKMLVLSRPDNSIKIRFDRHTQHRSITNAATGHPISAIVRLRGEDESGAISKDIELVVREAIADLIDKGLPFDLLENVERDLITRADRTFLWATLIIQLLKDKVVEGASMKEMDAILRSRDIYSIYTALLESKVGTGSVAKEKARKMLSLILGAMRPLTVDDLNIALAIKPDHDTFTESAAGRKPSRRTFQSTEYKIVYPAENHIKSVCGHFVRIIHQKVYLVHQTAREFLLDEASLRGLETIPIGIKAHEELWDFSDSEPEDGWSRIGSDPEFGHSTESMTVTSGIGSEWQHTLSLENCHALLLEAYDDKGRSPNLGGSSEEQQDLLIEILALEPGLSGFGRNLTSRVDFTKAYEAGISKLQLLSCNPSRIRNLVFPMKADETGTVSLDFGLAERGGVTGHLDRHSRPLLAHSQQATKKT